jgi:L-fuconolactonase
MMTPPLAITDTHHHLWDADLLAYSLLDGPLRMVKGRYDAGVFDETARRHGIGASICVEAVSAGADAQAETRWLLGQAATSKVVGGIVVWAPLGSGEAGPYIDDVLDQAGSLVKGVRRSFESAPGDALMSTAVRTDARAAGERGLSVDLVLFEGSLPEAFQLVRDCGGTRFVLDHLGKPHVQSGALEPWRTWMAALGQLDNIVCKISGLAVEAHNPGWSVGDLAPYLDIARECFEVERLMFGSDWPVCDLAGGIGRWIEAVGAWTAGWTEGERRRLYSENAAAFWGLAGGAGQL